MIITCLCLSKNLDFALKVRKFTALAFLSDDRIHDVFEELRRTVRIFL